MKDDKPFLYFISSFVLIVLLNYTAAAFVYPLFYLIQSGLAILVGF